MASQSQATYMYMNIINFNTCTVLPIYERFGRPHLLNSMEIIRIDNYLTNPKLMLRSRTYVRYFKSGKITEKNKRMQFLMLTENQVVQQKH